MKIADSTMLVTGANRGLGKALVEEALSAGAQRVYAAARAMLDGVEKEDEEIFPDPTSEAIADGWRSSAVKALQCRFAAYVEQTPVKVKSSAPGESPPALAVT